MQECNRSAQDRERQYYFAVLVSLVRSSEEIADAPDEAGELLVRLDSHGEAKLEVIGQNRPDAQQWARPADSVTNQSPRSLGTGAVEKAIASEDSVKSNRIHSINSRKKY